MLINGQLDKYISNKIALVSNSTLKEPMLTAKRFSHRKDQQVKDQQGIHELEYVFS